MDASYVSTDAKYMRGNASAGVSGWQKYMHNTLTRAAFLTLICQMTMLTLASLLIESFADSVLIVWRVSFYFEITVKMIVAV